MASKFTELNDREWLYRKYWIEGKSMTQISGLLGCDPKTVQQALVKHEIPRRTRGEANVGRELSEETKRKLSKARQGKRKYTKLNDKLWLLQRYTVEDKTIKEIAKDIGCSYGAVQNAMVALNITRRKSGRRVGTHLSNETKRKISTANKGRTCPEDVKERLSKLNKGEKHPMYGKKRPIETRRKMSEARRGKRLSEETRRKISEAHKGLQCGERHPMYGRHHTEEARRRISESHKGLQCKEKNPAWKGGISFEPYCPKFSREFRERVRDYFDRRCYLCNKTEKENGRRLDVHHVLYNKNTCCDKSPKLFVPLCKSCHMKTGFNREYWQEFFATSLMFLTNGECFVKR